MFIKMRKMYISEKGFWYGIDGPVEMPLLLKAEPYPPIADDPDQIVVGGAFEVPLPGTLIRISDELNIPIRFLTA